ncbi:MAG: hypothetical protein CAF44_016585 [Nitrospira sp. CG24D]|nr:MAG: hypothetical protein CAF44_016585 [Nitrospira sp. CG24D]
MRCSHGFLFVAVAFLTSCSSSEVKLSSAIQSSLKGEQQILAVHYYPQVFSAQTPEVRNEGSAGMMFGAVGGAIAGALQANKAEKAGGQLVREYHLEDPMPRVKQAFIGNLVHEHSFQNIRSLDDVLANDNLDALKKKFEKGLLFDFKTISWSLNLAGPLSRDTYRVNYVGRVRLLRFPEGTIAWQSVCETDGKIEGAAPTLLEVVANSGEFLKSQLNNAVDVCLAQFERQFKNE